MIQRGPAAALWMAAAVFTAVFATRGAAAGQTGGPLVARTGADTVVVAPGGRGTAAFRVSNPAPREAAIRIGVESPAGWRLFQPPADVTLPPDSGSLLLIGFFVPETAPAGVYPIRLSAAAAGHSDAKAMLVRVSEAARVEAAVESAPRWAVAGDTFQIVFRVTNTGNVPLPIHLLLKNPGDVAVRIDRTVRTLEPGASMPIPAEFSVSKDLRTASSPTFWLQATSGPAIAEVPVRVDLIPSGSAAGMSPATIPGRLEAGLATGALAGSSLRVDLSGPLRPGSATRIDLLVIPEIGQSRLGQSDIYRLGLESSRYSLRLGDQVYALSPLSETGRQGTGAEARLRAGAFEVGGYAERNRHTALPDGRIGAFAQLRLNGAATGRVNWLTSRTGARSREVWTGQASLRLPGWGEVDGEYGIRPENGTDARTLRARLGRGAVSLDLHHVRGDSAFGGRHAGISQDAVFLTVHPWRDLSLNASLDHSVSEGTAREVPFRDESRSLRFGAAYGSWIAVEAAERALSGASAWMRPGTARSIQARSTFSLGAVSLYSSAEGGYIRGPESDAPSSYWGGRIQASLTVEGASLSGSVTYFDGPTLYSSIDRERLTASGSAGLALGPATHLDLSVEASQDIGGSGPMSMLTRGRIRQALPFGDQISLEASSRMVGLGEIAGAPQLRLNYSVPFRVPGLAAASGQTGSATVTLVDGATGAPLPRVVVRIGDLARSTDRGGQATFERLPSGVHYLVLDRATAGVEFVSTKPLPLAVDIRAGEDAGIELGLVRAASIRSRVLVARTSSITAARGGQGEPEPLTGAVLEFSRGDERIRRVTDDKGTVELFDLRPGRWTVSIERATLPPFHRFERESFPVELGAGGHEEIAFLASPKERRVNMVASGAVIESGPRMRAYLVTGLELTLRGVAGEVYRNPELWPKIWLANCGQIPDPNMIRSGQTLIIPPGDELTPEEWGAIGPDGPRPGACRGEGAARRHRVTGVEFTLSEIARTVYGDASLWPKIWYANRHRIPNPDEIRSGQVLDIPPKGPLSAEERQTLENYRRQRDGGEASAPTP